MHDHHVTCCARDVDGARIMQAPGINLVIEGSGVAKYDIGYQWVETYPKKRIDETYHKITLMYIHRKLVATSLPYTLVNKRILLIGAYILISAAGLPALITLLSAYAHVHCA